MNSRPCFSRNHILVRKRRSRRRKRRRIRRKGEGAREDETLKMKLQTPNSKFQGSSKSQTAKRTVNHSKRKLWLIGAATQSGRGQRHSKTLRTYDASGKRDSV